MEWNIEYVENEKYIRVTTSGSYNPQEHLRMMKELLAADFWKPDTPVLLDNRKLDYSETDLEDLKQSSHDMLVNNELIGHSKIAFLIGTKESYEVVRQFELITEEEVSAWMHIFMDEKQAVRWLLAYRTTYGTG